VIDSGRIGILVIDTRTCVSVTTTLPRCGVARPAGRYTRWLVMGTGCFPALPISIGCYMIHDSYTKNSDLVPVSTCFDFDHILFRCHSHKNLPGVYVYQ